MEEFVSFPPSDSQNLCTVNWINHSNHILKQLKLFFGPGGMFENDVNVICDRGTVRCHQMLLAIGSDYFADIFTANPVDRIRTIELPKISAKTFRYIYQFMLYGTIALPLVEVNSFVETGEKLKVVGLMNLPKGMPVATATGKDSNAVKISSNFGKTPFNFGLTKTVGGTELVKNHESQSLFSSSVSGLKQLESAGKLKCNFQKSGDEEVEEASGEKGVDHTSKESEQESSERKVEQASNDKKMDQDVKEKGVDHESSEEEVHHESKEKGVDHEASEKEEDQESKEEGVDREFNEEESSEEEEDQKSKEKGVDHESSEEESSEEEVHEESKEEGVDSKSNEEEVDHESYDNESENVSSVSKSNIDDGNKTSISLNASSDDESDDSDFKSSNSNKKTDSLKAETDQKTDNLENRNPGSINQNRKRKFKDADEFPRSSKSKRASNRGRKGSIEHRGRFYTVKEAKEIGVTCPVCFKLVRLSNFKNHQLTHSKKKTSKKVSEKMDANQDN